MDSLSDNVAFILSSVQENDALYGLAQECLNCVHSPDVRILDYKDAQPEGKKLGEVVTMLRARSKVWRNQGMSFGGADESMSKLSVLDPDVRVCLYVVHCGQAKYSVWYDGNKKVVACLVTRGV